LLVPKITLNPNQRFCITGKAIIVNQSSKNQSVPIIEINDFSSRYENERNKVVGNLASAKSSEQSRVGQKVV